MSTPTPPTPATPPTHISRRNLLKLGAASAAAFPLIDAQSNGQASASSAKPSPRLPRNIIFMISDGMSAGVPAMAEAFSQLVRGTPTNWHRLSTSPQTAFGYFDMASLNSLVTDSAAAASAWFSGSRIFNWAVNMLPDGTKLTPLGPLAKQAGFAVGAVTTTRVTHATPACFIASVKTRNDELNIAPQFLDSIDILLGGGMRFFDPAKRSDKRDLVSEFRTAGYSILTTRDELLANPLNGKALGLFSENHVPYTIDRNRDAELQRATPTLAEMTQAALAALSKSQKGFLLQVEGGRVDHAAHNNDAAAMLWDQLAFDDAIGVAEAFCEAQPDTLVIITSDHGCGNPGLNGMGNVYQNSTKHFENLARATASFEAMESRLKSAMIQTNTPPTPASIIETLDWGTSIEISEKDAAIIADVMSGKPAPELNSLEANIYGVTAQILGNHTGIGWTGIAHTSDWTMSMALGPGRERFVGLLKNTDAYFRIAEFMGIEHRNPSMTPEEAQKFALEAGVDNHTREVAETIKG